MAFKLYKPLTVDDKEVKTLDLDFDSLPCDAISKAEKFLAARRHVATIPSTDTELNSMLAGMAGGLALEDAWALSVKDKFRLAGEAQSFFLLDSEEP